MWMFVENVRAGATPKSPCREGCAKKVNCILQAIVHTTEGAESKGITEKRTYSGYWMKERGSEFWYIISEEYGLRINEEGSVGQDHWIATLTSGCCRDWCTSHDVKIHGGRGQCEGKTKRLFLSMTQYHAWRVPSCVA